VIFRFFFAGRAGEVMHIVVIHAVLPDIAKTKEKHKDGIDKQKKGKRTTVKQKIDVDTV